MVFQKIKQVNWMEMSGLLVGVISTVAVMIFSLVLYTTRTSVSSRMSTSFTVHSTRRWALKKERVYKLAALMSVV